MKYINKKTQVVIDTACVIQGGDWEEVAETQKSVRTQRKSAETAKKTRKKGDE